MISAGAHAHQPLRPVRAPGSGTKRVLVVGGSQSGQLDRILDRIIAPLHCSGAVEVDRWRLDGFDRYPFPWGFWEFLDAFPESVQQDAPPLRTTPALADDYDLIVLGYQVWFLSPSLPVTAFLESPQAQRLLAGKPVVAVAACRNMWMAAWQKLRTRLEAIGARVIDHVVLVDQGPTLATFITTPRWLLTGRRDPLWGMPAAGVSDAEIKATERFGKALCVALSEDREQGASPLLAGLGAVKAEPRLALSERAGARAFSMWSRIVRAAGKAGQRRRRPVLFLFVTYLVLAIVTIVPLSLALQSLLAPLLRKRFERIRAEFEAPSGSGTERIQSHV